MGELLEPGGAGAGATSLPPPAPSTGTPQADAARGPEATGGATLHEVQKLIAEWAAVDVAAGLPLSDALARLRDFELPLSLGPASAAGDAPAGEADIEVPTPEQLHAWNEALLAEYGRRARTIGGTRDPAGRLLDRNRQVLSQYVQIALKIVQAFLAANSDAFAQNLDRLNTLSRPDKVALMQALMDRAAEVRTAKRELDAAERALGGPLARKSAQEYYENSLQEAQYRELRGWRDGVRGAQEMYDQAAQSAYGRYVAARQRYIGLLDDEPLLGLTVPYGSDWSVSGRSSHDTLLYEWLLDVRLTPNPTNDATVRTRNELLLYETLNRTLAFGAAEARKQATRFRMMDTLEQLAELASSRYAAVHDHLARTNPPLMTSLMAELRQAERGALSSWTEKAWDDAMNSPLFIPIAVSIAFIPGVGIPLALALTAYQLYRSGSNYIRTSADAANASAIAGIAGHGGVLDTREAFEHAETDVSLQVIQLPLVAAGTAAQVRAIRQQRAQRAAFEELKATYPMRAAFRDAFEEAIPNGRPAVVTEVTDPAAILDRLETGGHRRYGDVFRIGVGDARFFLDNRLAPRRTVQSGGFTWHLSAPFKAPGDRIAVIAFQEWPDGAVVPRSFYLSGSHGVWRAATGAEIALGGTLDDVVLKGHRVYLVDGVEVDAATAFKVGARSHTVNESAATLGPELQAPLSRWLTERGAIDLPDSVTTRRAFLGHLEVGNGEFGAFVSRADIERPFSLSDPEVLPDLRAGPVGESWTVPHAQYGTLTGQVMRSRDGTRLFIVMRDSEGRTFVPDVQDAEAGLTPFGTRWRAIQTDLTTTPLIHRGTSPPRGAPIPGSGYNYDPNYRNGLNALFENTPTPGPSTTGTSASTIVDPPITRAPRPVPPGTLPPGASSAATTLDRSPDVPARGGDTLSQPRRVPSADANTLPEHVTGGQVFLFSALRNPFNRRAHALLAETTAVTGILVRSRGFGGLAGDDAVALSRLSGWKGEPGGADWALHVKAYIDNARGRGFVSDRIYEGSVTLDEGRIVAVVEAGDHADLVRFVDDYAAGRRVAGWSASPPSRAAPDRMQAPPNATPAQILIEPPRPGPVYRLSALQSPFRGSAHRQAEEWNLLTETLRHARVTGRLAPDDGERLARLAGDDPLAYFRDLAGRGFLADDAPMNHAAVRQDQWMPMLDTAARLDLHRYFEAYRAGTASRDVTVGAPAGARAMGSPVVIFRSLGQSSGAAFQMTVLNPTDRPFSASGESVVLEPVVGVTDATIDAELAKVPSAARATATVDAYCLEFLKSPPTAGMVFRLAPDAVQQRFARTLRIFDATRALRDAGRLQPPEGDPTGADDYFHAVRQWAIWTREQEFDETAFSRAFVEHARKNIVAAGDRWSPELQQALEALVPARWQAVQTVLRQAAPPRR